ncbi:MAG TPA: LysR family transcriptional regulator [Streptosporangiaceae bacterium]|jgi:DNA-binding transcriptional LysR family regulator
MTEPPAPPPAPPDLASLRLLVSVGELGSLGQAARAAGIAQPSASKRIAVLERRLGVPLLDRGPRGSALTAEGKIVADWAAQVLAAADQLMRGVGALREHRRATLRIAASLTVAEYLMPRWLHDFQLDTDHVQAGLLVANSTEVIRMVGEGEVELGFVEGPDVPRTLTSRTVATDRLVVVVTPDHPWSRRRRPLRAAELATTPLVVREAGSGTRDTLDRVLRAAGTGPVAEPHLELGSTAAVKGAVAAGSAPAVISGFAVESELSAGRLVAVPVTGLDLTRKLRAVWPRGRHLIGPAATLLRVAARSRTA